jgi:hypothetical protein
VSANNGRIEHDIFHIGISGEVFKHLLPYADFTPATESFVHAIPLAIFSREQAPLRPTPQYPKHGFDKTPSFSSRPDLDLGAISQELLDFCPLYIV